MSARLACLALALLACGCSAIVSARDPRLPCEQPADGSNPCPSGSHCGPDGFCTPDEICDGADNDLDGRVDEDFDRDRDTFLWCGRDPAYIDCDDTNPMIHPADPESGIAPAEICNGTDDDCNPRTSETTSCGDGEVCSAERGGCVIPDCTFPERPCPAGESCNTSLQPPRCEDTEIDCRGGDPCPPGQVCETVTNRCVTPLSNGLGCNADIECGSERCITWSALRITPPGSASSAGLCGVACCSDADCDGDATCWASGSGARSCVPRTVIAAGPQGLPLSGMCSRPGACEGARCSARLAAAYDRTDLAGFYCAGGPVSDPNFCDTNAECESGICLILFSSIFGDYGVCSPPCATSGDCPRRIDVDLRCGYIQPPGSRDWLQMCVTADDGTSSDGASCSGDGDCLDGACIEGRCAGVCCRDSDCGGDTLCRPVSRSGRWEMHCVPRRS